MAMIDIGYVVYIYTYFECIVYVQDIEYVYRVYSIYTVGQC